MLLTVIGEEAREVFFTFTGWAADSDDAKIDPVLAKFEEYVRSVPNRPEETRRKLQLPGNNA